MRGDRDVRPRARTRSRRTSPTRARSRCSGRRSCSGGSRRAAPGCPTKAGRGTSAMPAWEKFLTEEEIWDAILFLYDFTGQQAARQGRGRARMTRALLAAARWPSSRRRGRRARPRPRAPTPSGRRARRSTRSSARSATATPATARGTPRMHLQPRPRNFTTGKFKIRTTPSGALPTTDDLKHIIRRGMPYTSMPAWPQLHRRRARSSSPTT